MHSHHDPLACRRDSWAWYFILSQRQAMSFTTESLQPLAWLALAHVSSQGCPSRGLKLTPGVLGQGMPGIHLYVLCVPTTFSM